MVMWIQIFTLIVLYALILILFFLIVRKLISTFYVNIFGNIYISIRTYEKTAANKSTAAFHK